MIDRALIRQTLMFGIVGLLATGLHYVIALETHQLLDVNLYVANLLGYAGAVGVSYFGHGMLTFQVELSRHRFYRFVTVALAILLASETILLALKMLSPLNAKWALAVVVLVIPVLSFLFNKLWVYRPLATSKAIS